MGTDVALTHNRQQRSRTATQSVALLRYALTHSGFGANRSDRAKKLRRGAPEYCRPIPHLMALVDIDKSTIYETGVTEAVAHSSPLSTRAINS